MDESPRLLLRAMVRDQLVARGIRDARVLAAMEEIPRHLFVPERQKPHAYEDHPLPIGWGQTISQPYMVARMLECLELTGDERVLEIGTGSGYQAALLGRLARSVHSVEIIPSLAIAARHLLKTLGIENVEVAQADGTVGWPAAAPFERVIVAAAAPSIPRALMDQLADPGRLVIPVGDRGYQTLTVVDKRRGQVTLEENGGCSFVPLVGEDGWQPSLAEPDPWL